ncbi:hypothetical protein A3Q56_06352 [Intoshia linei]|uniref:Tc3 transposase DNA binding domain-containing protein n=1 Tax=Intoshia linei TaxID=1819745 RepID=A0A177AX73_9BILA|nr:hypothetical protein A3Q56_06352 [Intoshia linei]
MPRGTLLSGYEKGQIDALLIEGKVVIYIAKSIGRSRRAIYKYIDRSGSLNTQQKLKLPADYKINM